MARSSQPVDLTGKVVAITGGARGIGRCTAEAFLRRGAKVVIGDVNVELCEKTAAELAAAEGAEIAGLHVDVTDRESFAAFLDRAEELFGPLDVLVNNAGIMPTGLFLDETHLEVHLYPAGDEDRTHLGTLVADTLTGSWEQVGAGAGASGSFRAERQTP